MTSACEFGQVGFYAFALLLRIGAAWPGHAAHRWVGWLGCFALRMQPGFLACWVWLRHGGHERLGVGLWRAGEELVDFGQSDQTPNVHHGDSVADVAHDAQVVGNEEMRQVVVGVQVLEQIEHFSPAINIRRFFFRPSGYGGSLCCLRNVIMSRVFLLDCPATCYTIPTKR